MPAKEIKRLFLYKHKDFFSVCLWQSVFSQRINKKKSNLEENTRLLIDRIVDFKKKGADSSHASFFRSVVDAAKTRFDCEHLAVIPSSSKGASPMQAFFGDETFERTSDVDSQKYNRGKKRPSSDLVKSLKIKSPASGKTLLLDDVVTSGKTMNAFADLLKGVEIVKFSFGVSKKLDPQIVDELILETEADVETEKSESPDSLNDLLSGVKDLILRYEEGAGAGAAEFMYVKLKLAEQAVEHYKEEKKSHQLESIIRIVDEIKRSLRIA